MIKSVDTYVFNKVKSLLNQLLNDKAVLNETLQNIDEKARERFIETFGGEDGKEINVLYSYPQSKSDFNAFVIEVGPSTMKDSKRDGSLGNVTGNYDYIASNLINEYGAFQYGEDEDKLYMKLSNPINDLSHIEGIEFSEEDNLSFEDSYLTINANNNEWLVGESFNIHYYTGGQKAHGISYGYQSSERVGITALSTNIDTLRCLDIILKTIFIIMRESKDEQFTYNLSKSDFSSLKEMISDGDRPVYARTLNLTYIVTHSVEYNSAYELSKLITR